MKAYGTAEPNFDFVLGSRLNWSKNVCIDCDAPNQIMFGAIDFHYCLLLALVVIHLEVFMGSEGGQGGLPPYGFGIASCGCLWLCVIACD
jgi:hypothetical protein